MGYHCRNCIWLFQGLGKQQESTCQTFDPGGQCATSSTPRGYHDHCRHLWYRWSPFVFDHRERTKYQGVYKRSPGPTAQWQWPGDLWRAHRCLHHGLLVCQAQRHETHLCNGCCGSGAHHRICCRTAGLPVFRGWRLGDRQHRCRTRMVVPSGLGLVIYLSSQCAQRGRPDRRMSFRLLPPTG